MNPGSTILITGGTGMVGKAISEALLERGFRVIILTRNKEKQKPYHQHLSYAEWDIAAHSIDKEAIINADYIIHLAGASIAKKRWTKKRKEEIVNSRVDSGKLIVESLKSIPNKVKAVISASAIGYYGMDSKKNPKPFVESDPCAADFLGQTGKKWEAAIVPVEDLGIRLVKLRMGIILSNEGGALLELKKTLKYGIASIIGSGSQVVSWIHIDDVVRMFLYMIDNENLSGTFNAVAPSPVSNKDLMLILAEKTRGKNYIPIHVPSIALRLMLGELGEEVLKSCTVSANKILQTGFIFQYPEIKEAIEQLKN